MVRESRSTLERRHTPRSKKTFKPACIEVGGKTYVATLRDVSELGCGFEGEVPLKLGQTIRYRWGNEPPCSSRVIWIEGRRFGVQNDVPRRAPSCEMPYRSVRIPIRKPTEVYLNGIRIAGTAVDAAQRGLRIALPVAVPPGSQATIKVGRAIFENATARWSKGGEVGFALPAPISIKDLAALASDLPRETVRNRADI